jgi:outer membrane protein assembly factor BamB
MKTSRLVLLTFVIVLALFLAACTGTAMNVSWPGLTADETQAYVANGQYVHALNLKDGTEIWKYPTSAGSKTFYASPVLTDDGQLLVGEYQNLLESLDPKTGALKWTFSGAKGRFVGSPLVNGDTIYAPADDNALYAIDLKGNLKWKFKTKKANWATPAADDKYIYLSSMDHNLYALNPKNGAKVWALDLGAALISSPVIGPDGAIIVGTLGNEVVAVNRDNGKVLWRKPTSGGIWGTPVKKDNVIYFGDASGSIYAMDVANQGEIVWQQKPGDAIIGGAALMANGLVLATESGKVLALDFTGATLWPFTADGKLYTTPVFVNNMLLISLKGGLNGQLLDAHDNKGSRLWIFTPGK